jgi:hypothetical protein
MHFNEPVNQIGCQFDLVPRSRIKNSPYQRDLSGTLVNHLTGSLVEGFIIPVVLVDCPSATFDEDHEPILMYEMVDGQHRLGAADKNVQGDYLVPSIIVPRHFIERFLLFNIEKSDNIRDQATKVYNFYIAKHNHNSSLPENAFATAFGYMSYLISIAFAYRELNLQSPSLIESPCKKLDNKSFLTEPLFASIEIRRQRATIIKLLEDTVQAICDNHHISDFNLKKAIISKASQELWGRKRNIMETFDGGMTSLIQEINSMDWSWMADK